MTMTDLPNVADIVNSWAEPLEGFLVRKAMEDRLLRETRRAISFRGVPPQPLRSQELSLKPEGERNWRYFTLYCDFDFRVDDIVILNGTEYRVTAKNDWNSYGFRKYELAEGYGGKLS